jgi:hypothetical protein
MYNIENVTAWKRSRLRTYSNGSAQKPLPTLSTFEDAQSSADLQTISNLIRTLVDRRKFRDALPLLDYMDRRNLQPNAYIYVFLLKACANIKDLEFGKRVHARIQYSGLEWTLPLRTSLLSMYTKCKYKSGISAVLTGFHLLVNSYNIS